MFGIICQLLILLYKSSGPDRCDPHVLREVREGIVTPLYLIFKKSLEEGKVPTAWKDASVTALHKSGDKSLTSNYQPVSLTSVICKMLEHIIKNHLHTILIKTVQTTWISSFSLRYYPTYSSYGGLDFCIVIWAPRGCCLS